MNKASQNYHLHTHTHTKNITTASSFGTDLLIRRAKDAREQLRGKENGFLTCDKEESANQVDISETAVRIRKQWAPLIGVECSSLDHTLLARELAGSWKARGSP